MKAFAISELARQDLLGQFHYLAEHADETVAFNFLEAAEAAFLRIQQIPEIGTAKFLINPSFSNLRSWPIFGFEIIQIYYLIRETQILVVRVCTGNETSTRFWHPNLHIDGSFAIF